MAIALCQPLSCSSIPQVVKTQRRIVCSHSVSPDVVVAKLENDFHLRPEAEGEALEVAVPRAKAA